MLALLLESALRLLALGGVVWLGLRFLRVRNPHVEMTAWTVVLFASLSMPVLMRCVTVTIPAAPPPSQLAQIVSASLSFPVETTRSSAGPTQPAMAPPAASDPGAIDGRSGAVAAAVDWRVVATAIYAAVAVVLLLRLLTGLVLTWRLARAARPLGDGWAGAADVRVSDAVGVPVTFGSTILLPPDCVEWSSAKQQAVLAHEGSHVAHGDFYVLLLAMLNRAVFWFSPFAWWQLRRLADLAEIISDDAAIEALDDRASYAGILLGVASEAQHAPAGIAMARPGTVRRRLERILAATAVSARGMGWGRRALIASTLVPLIAVCAGSIARGTSTAQPTAGSAAQSEPDAGGHTMLSAQRKLAAVDAKLFDDYVGHYQLSRTAIFTVTRSDDQLFAQRTGQRKVQLHPLTTNEYVYGSSTARVTFVTDDQGTATALVVHQNGQKWPSVRVDEAKATAIEGVFARQIAAAPDRFRDQTPVHGSKDAVLSTIAELQHAAPNYDRMSRSLVDSMRPQMPQLHSMLTALGSVDSIFFRGVGPGGYDIYGVKFANGFAEFRLLMGADDTIEDVVFRPDGDDTPGGIAACSEAQSLKPSAGTTPIRLLLFNGTGADIHLFELDLKGKRTPRVTIGDERSASILTYVGRPWIIADSAGKCLEIVWPGQRTRFLAVQPPQRGDQPARPTATRRTPAYGSEEALRQYIEGLARGEPNYGRMTSEVAGETRRQLPLNQAVLAKLGALRAMSFRGVSPLGSDIYTVHFANGSAEWRISLVKEGRIGRIALGPQY